MDLKLFADQLFKQARGKAANTLRSRAPHIYLPGSFPLDNPLTRLQGNSRYLLRQGQGLLQKAQSFGPTALNPLASRTPTTNLGKLGSMLNPLNPANFRNLLTGSAISAFVPDNSALKGNLEIFALAPGNPVQKTAATLLFGAVDAGPRDEMALERELRAKGIMPAGGDSSVRNKEGKVWAGTNYGFQSPESFNKLYGANLPITPTTGGILPVDSGLPADYKQTELEAGAAVVPQLSPEELAYNQERSRIAQLTAATPEERSKLRDEGMRIWAAKYRDDLAKQVKPGQSGYEVIQQVLNK